MREISFKKENVKLDDGVFFGRGAFETILVKDEPILFKNHIKRLNNAISILNIGEKIDEKELLNEIKKYEIKNKALKIIVTPKNIILKERDIIYKDEDYEKGFKLKISKVIRNSTSILTYVKSTNYIENLIENQKAKEEGYNEVIFLNENGFVTECSTANIFMVKDNVIYTPKVECGLLNGILREFIINNFKVIEKEITIEELLESEEVFITNSLLGIMKVVSISYNCNNKISRYSNEWLCKNQSKTNEIISIYKEYVEKCGGEKHDG